MNALRFAAIAGVLAIGLTLPSFAQELTHGQWFLGPVTGSTIRLDLRDDEGAEHENDASQDIDRSAIALTDAQLNSAGEHVAFTLTRDGGTFTCDGWAAHGGGSGAFTFAPNQRFVDDLQRRGYTNVEQRKLVAAALMDISFKYIDSISDAGYNHLPFDQLIAFRALRVDGPYIRDMRGRFGALSPSDVISLRALRVTSEYLDAMKAAGVGPMDARQAVSMTALHVDAAYVREMAAAGYPHLTPEQLVQLRAMHIDADYIKRVAAHGFTHLTVERLVQVKAMNVI